MRVWSLVLMGLCLSGSAVSGVPSLFEKAATAYAKNVKRCWGVTQNQPSPWEHRQIIKACQKWARIRWPNHVMVMEERLYRLYLSEGPNPEDPSYGWLGVTIPAARWVEKKYTPKGYAFPKSDKALGKRLTRDVDFNFMVGSGELFHCMKGRSIRYETWAIMRYKLGIRGAREFHKARAIRRKAWFAIRRHFQCVRKRIATGDVSRTCECMRG